MDFKENCFYMSYRYAIGRKSINAVSHARDCAMHLDWIPDERKEFTGNDIIKEINYNLYINAKNIVLTSTHNENYDIYSVLFKWFEDNPQEDMIKYFMEHMWHIDCDMGIVKEVKDRASSPQRNEHGFYTFGDIFSDYSDYKDWISLAKMLRKDIVEVEVDYEGVVSIYECYETWSYNHGKPEKRYSDMYNGFPDWHFANEYIIEVY